MVNLTWHAWYMNSTTPLFGCFVLFRIVAVLTPKYLDNTVCLEQFNLALCCNRLTKAEVLAPFYLQTVDAFPAYMTLIQYTECVCVCLCTSWCVCVCVYACMHACVCEMLEYFSCNQQTILSDVGHPHPTASLNNTYIAFSAFSQSPKRWRKC